jgi:hypothetical protein
MPIAAMMLKPGVDTQQTPALNSAGLNESQLIRYKNNLVQTYGGWTNFFNFTLPPVARSLHVWRDNNGSKFLSVAGSNSLTIIEEGDEKGKTDITPRTFLSNSVPNLSIGLGS